MTSSAINYSTHNHSLAQKLIAGSDSPITKTLHNDHVKVSNMFFHYQELYDGREKQNLLQNIIHELFAHTSVEEEVVYSNVRKVAMDDRKTQDMMDEAETEHHMIKVLMLELLMIQPDYEFYEAKVRVLGEMVRHHMSKEEKYMFAMIRDTDINLEQLTEKYIFRQEEFLTLSTDDITNMLELELQEVINFSTTAGR